MFSEKELREAEERLKERLRETVRQDARRELKYRVLGQGLSKQDQELTIQDILHSIWRYSSVDGLGGLIYARTWISDEEREQIVRGALRVLLDENKENESCQN